MKTPKEIEQLAESQYGTEIGSIRGSNPYDLEADRKNGYVKGYTQCQKDMAYKKYTEEDIRKAIRNTITYLATLSETGKFHSGNIIEEAIINSLNKQD
jgi:hypothetical protein